MMPMKKPQRRTTPTQLDITLTRDKFSRGGNDSKLCLVDADVAHDAAIALTLFRNSGCVVKLIV